MGRFAVRCKVLHISLKNEGLGGAWPLFNKHSAVDGLAISKVAAQVVCFLC